MSRCKRPLAECHYGLLAPFLLVGILIVASDGTIMQGQPSPWLSRITVGIITLVMFGAAIAMFVL